MQYILITQEFAEAMDNKQSPINPNSTFGYGITTNGQYVTSLNSAVEFPQDFIGAQTTIDLTRNDFPKITPAI